MTSETGFLDSEECFWLRFGIRWEPHRAEIAPIEAPARPTFAKAFSINGEVSKTAFIAKLTVL